MKGSECRLFKFMEGSSTRFIIPVYQRNYDWKTENCKQLYDDLVKVIKSNRSNHFFGSIVSVYEPTGKDTVYLIIDGQQRLTTVSLLFLAMYNLLEEGKIVATKLTLNQQIFDYLVDRYQPEETRVKLKPIKNDQRAFQKLFDRNEEPVHESNLTTNYQYFYERIQKQEISIDELFDAICRLIIINIELNGEDNPQLIFESLNSTGLDLSEGDKIRNFILMGLPSEQQNAYYQKYWNKIEEYTKYDVSAFVRDYLSLKQQVIPAQKKIYLTFKEYVEGLSIDTEKLLIDLLAYAKRYQILLSGGAKNRRLDSCIDRLNRLETTVTRPFFLEVLRLYDTKTLDISEVTEIFLITENYLFRRNICNLPTNALNKIFLTLHREIVRYDGTEEKYIDKFKYALFSKKDRARFPNDEEFGIAFTEREIYKMNSKNKVYIFERLENFGTDEDKDIYRHCDEGIYSIEHIMPQHLTPNWERELGEDCDQIHETWLHRIANLTLTAYNSKYSNNSFSDKKTMKNGFLHSGIRMNTYIAQKERWTLDELEKRSQYLLDRALEIWKLPGTDYQPPEKEMDSCSLDDDLPVSGRMIAKFRYKNMEQPTTSWTEMFESILKILHTEDKSVLTKLAYNTDPSVELARHISYHANDLSDPIQIDENIFVKKYMSTEMKLSLLRKFFNLYDIDPSDLIFYLRDDEETIDANEKIRYLFRHKYWTYALDMIKEANKVTGAFQKNSPKKWNGIHEYFGIQGIYLVCKAQYSSARVEIFIGKPKEDKKIFDQLQFHKDEIESALGISLIWDRCDKVNNSKIFYQLEGVSVTKESDWLQMAQFHAKWSQRFYEVFVPYLKKVSE